MAVDGPPDMGGWEPGQIEVVAPAPLERLAEMIARRLAALLDARPLYTTKTLAERLDLSERAVQELLQGPEPEIRSFVVGSRSRRIAPSEVDRYLAARQDLEPVGD